MRAGSQIPVSLPGIAQPFLGEILEVQEQNSQSVRLHIKALEPVYAFHGEKEVLYEKGSRLWLTLPVPTEEMSNSLTVSSNSTDYED